MKKTMRKHGLAARSRHDVHEAGQSRARLTTQVTFESSRQSYLWFTDRGRSRLIKH